MFPIRSTHLPEEKVVESIKDWFPRLHSLIIGPGLGRDPLVLSRVKKIIAVAKELQKNLVIDAVSTVLPVMLECSVLHQQFEMAFH